MIKITDLDKCFGSRTLFDNLNLSINEKEKVGLVGRNGHGKTSLFKMILGKMEYDSGLISIPKNYKIGYLEQHINFTKNTAVEEACLALTEVEKDGKWKAEKILSGLGFSRLDMLKNPNLFSGGYKIRINLAKVLLSDANMLMLDEPNNYLDIVAIRWLSGFLRSWKSELILITHDRSFMDSVITHCTVIHRTKARKIEGTTQKLYEQIEKEEEIYEKTRRNIEKKKKQTELFIRRFRAKARLAGMVQSRIKSLEKQETLAELTEIEDLDFSFSSIEFNAAKMLGVHNLSFRYSSEENSDNNIKSQSEEQEEAFEKKLLIKNLSFEVLKKERICVIGKNGKGKSTLLKLIAGRLQPNDGSIKTHPDLKISYFVQSDAANLNPLKTVYDEILNCSNKILPQKARNIAGAVMFSGDDALKKIDILSGGEKARVLLGKILATPCHLLLLDEPTNHLDMESCEGLIDAIDRFQGSVIMVTHNEEILRNVATKLIIFDRNEVIFFDGTYQDFLNKRGWEDENFKAESKSFNKESNSKNKNEIKKLRAQLIQEKSKTLKPLDEKVKKLETEIAKKEIVVNLNNEKLALASVTSDVKILQTVAKENKVLESEIEKLWMDFAFALEHLESETERFRKLFESLEY
jgi:ATP-binding cassette subfamily F protein 3